MKFNSDRWQYKIQDTRNERKNFDYLKQLLNWTNVYRKNI